MEAEEVQMRIYRQGSEKGLPVSFEEWEKAAGSALGEGPYGYVAGGAGSGETMRANREAFLRWRIRPRVCCDVSQRDLGIRLLDADLPVPFLLAPIGVLSILHPDAELAPARAAARTGAPFVLSNVSTVSMERVAEVMGNAVRWFQLYPAKDRELTISLLKRAEKAGYSAIVVTLDSTLLGWRERDLQNGYLPFLEGHGLGNYLSDPVFRSKLSKPPEEEKHAAILRALEEGNNTSFTWEEVAFIRRQTPFPLLLKGVLHPDDALIALRHGVDGLIVSNHGGRQLDGAIATLDALPSVCDAVAGRVPILIDGGIRGGADILKALALGATAVLIGRPYAYALGVAGETGVQKVIEQFAAELELQLAISGHRSVRDVDRSLLVACPG